jgi:hypothetical protein
MSKAHWRLTLAVIVLAIAVALLAWSSLPGPRVLRRQTLQPTEMQLPTPQSFAPLLREFVWVHLPVETACLPVAAARFALIL